MKSIDNSLLKLRRYLIDCFVIRDRQIELNEIFVNLPQMCKNNSKSLQEIVEKLSETKISAINAIKEKTLQEKNSLAICVSAHFEKFFININYVAKFSLYKIVLSLL